MLCTLLAHPSLAFISDDFRKLIVIGIPLAGMILGGVISISAMYFCHRRRELWHETARIALEKGQPLPLMPGESADSLRASSDSGGGKNDVRAGLILIAVGGGLMIFFNYVGAPQVAGVGAIPGLIGVALLLFAVFSTLFSRKGPGPGDRPPQS